MISDFAVIMRAQQSRPAGGMVRYTLMSPGDSMPVTRLRDAAGAERWTDCFGGKALAMVFLLPTDLSMIERLCDVVAHGLPTHAYVALIIPGNPCPLPAPLSRIALFDVDHMVSKRFGVFPKSDGDARHFRQQVMLFDPMSRLVEATRLKTSADLENAMAHLAAQPAQASFGNRPVQPPILTLPRVFSAELCATLIASHRRDTRTMSGVMRCVNGRTIGVHDTDFKRRRDYLITDAALIARIQGRIRTAVLPELQKAFGIAATRMERYLVGSYSANDVGHFAPHRDNTTPGTAHRRFAISINLNDDFDGGVVSFPEYGPEGIKAPAGGAVVFGCGLLHAVSPVTRGTRYTFLPFVYDEAGAQIRQANLARHG
ncbi:MAG: 2OG-Fe(II) oxygenase [Rhodobacteraceae bacterium]|nr:MAG: 2OG-Fe(II) oxygenase [Paracoccaceae bacterium]